MSSQPDRRRTKRRPLIESFSMFVSIPKKGGYRLKVHDISELGIGFDLDVEGEAPEFQLKQGELLDIHFYLNQTLYIPLSVKVARVENPDQIRRVGAEFPDRKVAPVQAVQAFVQMLDQIVDSVKFDTR